MIMKGIFAALLCCALALPAPICAQQISLEQSEAPPKPKPPEPLPLVTWEQWQQKFGGPTLVSLEFKDTPALEAIEALAQQAPLGVQALNRDEWERREPKTLSGTYRAQPFWAVTRDMLKQLDAHLENSGHWGTGAGISFHPYRGEGSALVSSNGPAILALSKADFYRVTSQGDNRQTPTESLNLSGKLYLDPKLRLLENALVLHLDEANTENGVSLLPEQDRQLGTKDFPIDLTLSLRPPAQNGGRLRNLTGTLHAAVAWHSESWQVSDVLNAKNQSHTFSSSDNSLYVELREIKKDGDAYQIVLVSVQNETDHAQPRLLSTGQQVSIVNEITDAVHLLGADGHYWLPMGGFTNYSSQAPNRLSIRTLRFVTNLKGDKSNAPPARLVVNYDADWRELIVPFSFENLPLP